MLCRTRLRRGGLAVAIGAAIPADSPPVLAVAVVVVVLVPLSMLVVQVTDQVLHHRGGHRVQPRGRLVIHDDLHE